MEIAERRLAELLARIVRQCVSEGQEVALDGLGSFRSDGAEGLRFIADSAPRVFIAYAEEDSVAALQLFRDLEHAGLLPWIDKRKLLPGQNWRRAIERAIERSDFFVPCFSTRSVRKRGHFQHELRVALHCAEQMPLDDNFIVPVRLDACELPETIERRIQHVDLFPNWPAGTEKLTASLWQEFGERLRHY